jgi:type IV pilus assembly protein PilY1
MPFDPRTGSPAVVFGLTSPRTRERWTGNLLQYALRSPAGPLEPPIVADRDGEPAIGTDGLPRAGTTSLWSEVPDDDLLSGGAAGRLPPPESRRLYTNVASERIVDPGNRLEPGNPRIGRDALGMGALDPESADELLASFRSIRTLGDPGSHPSAIADYPGAGLRIAFAASQDGLLHAFDADSGVELWAWMPRDLLARVPRLVRDAPTTSRSHGLDGPLVLHRYDPDGDGVIDPGSGEHLWLLFGQGRGGAHYHALDVSQPEDPTLLWSLQLPDSEVLALAEPVVARLRIADSGQGAGDWIVFLAGGYDSRFDARVAGGPGAGGTLLAVDAATGRRLWAAGTDEADLAVPGLASLAAAPRILDLDGDGMIDRAYALDVVGNLWRIDFRSGNAADGLASASRIAHVGGSGKRFHDTPDASVVRLGGRSLLALAFGSGSRMRPRDDAPVDALHVVYDSFADVPSRDLAMTDLHDATGSREAIPPDAPGWFLRLEGHGAGEKVAGPTATFDHALRFQTYQPLPPDPAAPCGPPRSVARRYTVDIRTAAPRTTVAGPEEELTEEVPASGLPPGLRFGFPGRWDEACAGCRPRPFGIQGGVTFDTGYAGDPVRTSWRKLVPPALR